MFERLRHDLELKKQMVTVSIIATIVILMEGIIFFHIVTPQVIEGLQDMLNANSPSLNEDPVLQALTRCTLSIGHSRELGLLGATNNGALLHAFLIGALPILFVLILWGTSEPLRKTSWKPIWIDVFVTAGFIATFQIAFYFFGQQWRYADFLVMVNDICKGYNEVSKATNAATDCGPCLEKLQKILDQSPVLRNIQQVGQSPDSLMAEKLQKILDQSPVYRKIQSAETSLVESPAKQFFDLLNPSTFNSSN